MANNSYALVTSRNTDGRYNNTLVCIKDFLRDNPDWRYHKEDFTFRCPGCLVPMHLCEGKRRAPYSAVDRNYKHDEECKYDHHQDEERKRKTWEYRKNRKEISTVRNVYIRDFQKRISSKNVKENSGSVQEKERSGFPNPLVKTKGEERVDYTIVLDNSEKEVDSIVDLYKQIRRRNDKEEINNDLLCKETKLKFRFEADAFGKPVLVMAKLLKNQNLLDHIQSHPEIRKMNPENNPAALMWDSFRTSVSFDQSGRRIEHVEEKVIFYLVFRSERQKGRFDKRFENYVDSKGRTRLNNTNSMPHLILCDWSDAFDGYTDENGNRRRIVTGLITNGDEEIRKLDERIFNEFEDESPTR